MNNTLQHRAIVALNALGQATCTAVAAHLGEPPHRVRWTLYHLRRAGRVEVASRLHTPARGRPRTLFAPRQQFALQGVW